MRLRSARADCVGSMGLPAARAAATVASKFSILRTKSRSLRRSGWSSFSRYDVFHQSLFSIQRPSSEAYISEAGQCSHARVLYPDRYSMLPVVRLHACLPNVHCNWRTVARHLNFMSFSSRDWFDQYSVLDESKYASTVSRNRPRQPCMSAPRLQNHQRSCPAMVAPVPWSLLRQARSRARWRRPSRGMRSGRSER